MAYTADTIVAAATPPGTGGVGIVRISGDNAEAIANAILGSLPEPRFATHSTFRNAVGEALDTGVALYFPGPASFTGESVLELQGHGGPVVMSLLVDAAVELGARQAEPGEFTKRAFLNDKLDLAQAEAIADIISSGTEQAARRRRSTSLVTTRFRPGSISVAGHSMNSGARPGLGAFCEMVIELSLSASPMRASRACSTD
jgi:tRNA modification GTPase